MDSKVEDSERKIMSRICASRSESVRSDGRQLGSLGSWAVVERIFRVNVRDAEEHHITLQAGSVGR
jgi:hypothetical protein